MRVDITFRQRAQSRVYAISKAFMVRALTEVYQTCDYLRCAWASTNVPFALWRGPQNFLTRFFLGKERAAPSSVFFLWPYGLRIYAWAIGGILSAFLYSGIRGQQLSQLDVCAWAIFAILFIVVIVPLFLFFFLSYPCA